eukprot:1921225-Rhodomonas_salina.1
MRCGGVQRASERAMGRGRGRERGRERHGHDKDLGHGQHTEADADIDAAERVPTSRVRSDTDACVSTQTRAFLHRRVRFSAFRTLSGPSHAIRAAPSQPCASSS